MKIKSQVLVTQTYEVVKAMILNQELTPGSKILQHQLAEDIGVSRTPLRSALTQLEAENLVLAIPRQGFYVRKFSKREIYDLFDCRIALESKAAELFATHRSAEDLAFVEGLFAGFSTNIDPLTYKEADGQFHAHIINNCGNAFLTEIVNRSSMLHNIDMIGLVRPPEVTLEEHREILAAIREQDPEAASEAMKNHLLKSKILIKEQVDHAE